MIYRFSVIPIKILMTFFTEIGKKSENSYRTIKDPKESNNLEKEKQSQSLTLPDLEMYYKTT